MSSEFDILNAEQMADAVSISYRLMLHVLQGGHIEGAVMKHSVGWRATRGNLVKWVNKGMPGIGKDDDTVEGTEP